MLGSKFKDKTVSAFKKTKCVRNERVKQYVVQKFSFNQRTVEYRVIEQIMGEAGLENLIEKLLFE